MFTLAHISDPHLPLPNPDWVQLLGKRITGFLSWKWKRQAIYCPKVREALVRDMKAQNPDHIAVTGDLVNISTAKEFVQANTFLSDLGLPSQVSLVPGNHDFYTYGAPQWGDAWANYMGNGAFPYVRYFGKIALIGLSSAIPTLPFMATGSLGAKQRRDLRTILLSLGEKGFFRLILIHHPPYGEKRYPRKSLLDARAFRELLRDTGAELVIHGHMHRTHIEALKVPGGTCPAIGVSSASALPSRHGDPAGYHLYTIEPSGQAWRIEVTFRQLTESASYQFDSQGKLEFYVP